MELVRLTGTVHFLCRCHPVLINLSSPEDYKNPSKVVVLPFLSGYIAHTGTVAKSRSRPNFSRTVLSSLGTCVING